MNQRGKPKPMAELKKCPVCEVDVQSNAPFGHCPKCLLELGFGAMPGDGVEPSEDSARSAPPIDNAGPASVTEAPGDYIDRYKLLQKIGEGGCGVVYMAAQEEPIRRRVALKVIKPGMDSRAVIARFEAERQALAMMDHPNIAKVLDAGQTATALPFFVMELVKGVRITEYCDQNNLPTPERLALFMEVCHAIQHAHQKGIIHRDIKPSNVLVTLHDGVPVPKVIDFGIAKALHQQRLTDLTLFTTFGQFMGTAVYMSPEQAEMSGLNIDTRCDIYSLGVLLYELLVGTTPFDSGELLRAGLDEMRRIIREQEPVRPSTHLSTLVAANLTTVASHRQCEPARLTHVIRGDLDWIVMKCLEKDRTRRYETASGLAADIQRHLQNEPVLASPPGHFYRIQKMVRRNKLAFAAISAVTVALLLGAVVSTAMFFKEQTALGGEKAAREQVEQKNAELERQNTEVELKKAEVERKNAEFRAMLVKAASSDRLIADEKLRNRQEQAAFAHLARACEYDPSSILAGEKAINALNVWNHMLPTVIYVGHVGLVRSAQFSPDDTRIVTSSDDKTARVWEAASGRMLMAFTGHEGAVYDAQFSLDGRRIVTASDDKTARVWDAATGKMLVIFKGHEGAVFGAQFSGDGMHIVTASDDKTACVWEVATGKMLVTLAGHERAVRDARFSPDGTRIVTASADKTARIWDVAKANMLAKLAGHDGVVSSVQFSQNGTRIVTASYDHTARVWDATTGKFLVRFVGHQDALLSAQFSRDGTRVVTASYDKTSRVWHTTTAKTLTTLAGNEGAVYCAAFSADGRRIVTASDDKTARMWDIAPRNTLEPLAGHKQNVHSAQFNPDGTRIVTASDDKTARVWDAISGKMLMIFAGHEGAVNGAQFSPDGTHIVTASADKTARVWDAAKSDTLTTLTGHEDLVRSAQFSPDGARIVTASDDKTARMWDAATGLLLATLTGHAGKVWSAQFSPDGTRIVTASEDKTARLWDAATNRTLATFTGHARSVYDAQFSRDGRRIVTASNDKTMGLWDAATGNILATLIGHLERVNSARFSPNSTHIVTASDDMTARVWDADTGKTLVTLAGHQGYVRTAQFSPDGTRIVTSSWDKTARVWELLPQSAGPPPEWFPDFLRYLAQMRLNTDGELETLKTADWLALRERLRTVLRASASADTPYLRILRKYLRE